MENLSFICGGLGEMEEDDDNSPIYVPGEYCLDNLKDLLRFLRRDDPETREVFKQVCKWNIVGKDILQIIQFCQNDTTLVLNAVKVLVFLTMPVDPTSKDIPQQIEYLWDLKSLITFIHVIPVIVTLLESPLEHLEGELFTDDDWKLVQLVVTLFRNMLAIQDITTQQRAAGSASELILLRDRFLQLLFDENVMDLILVLTQDVGGSNGVFRQDNLLLLETFYYTFKGQVPELVARAHLDANVKVVGETEATATDLKSIMEEEKAKRRQTILCNIGARSKFSGSFTRRTMGLKSSGDWPKQGGVFSLNTALFRFQGIGRDTAAAGGSLPISFGVKEVSFPIALLIPMLLNAIIVLLREWEEQLMSD